MKLIYIGLFASLIIVYQIGLCNILYITISIVAFLYGYVYFDCQSNPYFLKRYICQIPKGLSKIIALSKESDRLPLDSKISGSTNLDKAFVEVVDIIIRDYIDTWYNHISSDKNFSYEVRRSIYRMLSNLSSRCRNVDWISLITEDLPNEIGSHIRLYRLSNQYCRRSKDRDLHEEFFNLESETDKVICRQTICTDETAEKEYLSSISEFIIYIISSPEEYNNPPIRYFLRETLVNAVLLPTINLITDPDFINQYIVWLCKDNSYTSEYFIQAIRMSESRDELYAVIERLDFFAKLLRSRDSGGDDDAFIKAQLGSLEFVKKICQGRLQKLEEPLKDEDIEYSITRSVSLQKLQSISFEFVLERQIGLSLFLEFLTSIGSQNYLNTYINLHEYQLMFSKVSSDVMNDDVFDFNESSSKDKDMSAGSSVGPLVTVDQENFARKILKDCRDLKLADTLLDYVERNINTGNLHPGIFDDMSREIIETLKEARYFGAFKRSQFCIQFLDEIDYLRDDSQISDDDVVCLEAYHLAKIDQNGSDMISHNLVENDSYNVRIVDAEIIRNSYVLYTLVVIKTDKYGNKETWKTYRRYSDFDSLNSLITLQCGKIAQLRLPAKKPFNNMGSDFLEKRSGDLQEYISACLDQKIISSYTGLRQLIVSFIQRGDWDGRPQLNKIRSIVNPLKSVFNIPENLMGNLLNMATSISPKKSNPRVSLGPLISTDSVDLGKFGNDLEQNKADNIPIRILFLLVDEIFDLQNKSQVVRRGILVILRKIVKTFFGLKVNKIILEKAEKFTSADQVSELVIKLKESLWPNGKRVVPSPRDKMTKMRTRVLCRTKMLGSVSDEVSQFMGNETTRQGVQRVFDLCQDQILNRRLGYSILQLLLRKVFTGHNFELLSQFLLCPARCGKVCESHNLIAPDLKDWDGNLN